MVNNFGKNTRHGKSTTVLVTGHWFVNINKESDMGYELHHAIIVTSWNEETIVDLIKKASDIFEIGKQLTSLLGPVRNGYYSFMIGPDGSKEFWDASDIGNQKRGEFIKILKETQNVEWVLLSYPGDSNKPVVENWHGRRC